MDDAVLVGVGQGVQDIAQNERRQFVGQRPALLQKTGQGRPGDEFGDDVAGCGVGGRGVVDFDDVGVAQLGDGLRLAGEAFEGLGLVREMGVQNLDGHVAA